jgi:hypothetical protein
VRFATAWGPEASTSFNLKKSYKANLAPPLPIETGPSVSPRSCSSREHDTLEEIPDRGGSEAGGEALEAFSASRKAAGQSYETGRGKGAEKGAGTGKKRATY